MPQTCCAKPIARTIQVGKATVSLVGVDKAIINVYISGVDQSEEIKRDLLEWIKEFGNVIPDAMKRNYGQALFREYRKYVAAVNREERAGDFHRPGSTTKSIE